MSFTCYVLIYSVIKQMWRYPIVVGGVKFETRYLNLDYKSIRDLLALGSEDDSEYV